MKRVYYYELLDHYITSMSECTYFIRQKKTAWIEAVITIMDIELNYLNGVGLPQTKIIKELDYYITSASKCTYFIRQKKTA